MVLQRSSQYCVLKYVCVSISISVCVCALPPQWIIQTRYIQGKDPLHNLAAHFSFFLFWLQKLLVFCLMKEYGLQDPVLGHILCVSSPVTLLKMLERVLFFER